MRFMVHVFRMRLHRALPPCFFHYPIPICVMLFWIHAICHLLLFVIMLNKTILHSRYEKHITSNTHTLIINIYVSFNSIPSHLKSLPSGYVYSTSVIASSFIITWIRIIQTTINTITFSFVTDLIYPCSNIPFLFILYPFKIIYAIRSKP